MARKSIDKKAVIATDDDPIENEWKSFFVITEHWQSDAKFFADELRFLRSLIDKYFMWLIEEENIERTRGMISTLTKLEKRGVILDQNLKNHIDHLAGLIENPFSHDAQTYHDEHANLELSMSDFLKDFRMLKKEIFKLTEEIIDSEKSKHLLGR